MQESIENVAIWFRPYFFCGSQVLLGWFVRMKLSGRNAYIFIFIYIYISSSSCRAACADIPDRLSPFLPIIHCLRQVFRVTSRVLTQLLYVGSCWSSHSCTSMCGGPQEYIAYELVLASPAVSCVSGSSNLYSFCDGGQVSV